MLTRNELIEQLSTSTCRVIFTKVNGEERDMTCTLQESIVPQVTKTEIDTKPRKVNEESLSVWDTKAEGWRSFRLANVTSFSCL
jgi:hypothetical protein